MTIHILKLILIVSVYGKRKKHKTSTHTRAIGCVCVDVNVCTLEPNDVGRDICSDDGTGNVVRWSYVRAANKCDHIIFDQQCDSSGNVFDTKNDCEQLCKRRTDDDGFTLLSD